MRKSQFWFPSGKWLHNFLTLHQNIYHLLRSIWQLYSLLEIKTFGLVLEFEMWCCGIYAEVASLISCSFEVVAQIWLDPPRGFWGCRTTFIKYFFQKMYSFMLFGLQGEFLASNSLHNLRDHKWSCPCYNPKNFEQIEINYPVGSIFWLWCCLFQALTTNKTINPLRPDIWTTWSEVYRVNQFI